MNELQVSTEMNLPAILQNNELGKEEKKMFAIGVAKLSGAKNIQLVDGTLKIWENCLVNDINKKLFTFNEFFEALDKSIRKTAYNRLDYADIYKEAIKISYEKQKENSSEYLKGEYDFFYKKPKSREQIMNEKEEERLRFMGYNQ